MTIDEAIKHCEEVAEKNERTAKIIENNFTSLRREQRQEVNSCKECAKEHRQLAAWLKELKVYRETIEEIRAEQKDVYMNGYNEGYEDGYCYALEDSH